MEEVYFVYKCMKCHSNIGVKISLKYVRVLSPYKQIADFKKEYIKKCLYCQNMKDFQDVYTGDREYALTLIDESTGLLDLLK